MRFFNDQQTIVTDALDGFLTHAGPGRLARLDGFPHIKVVMRAEIDGSKVAVVSGGGAGHEPAHVGYVGEGMLSAAVSGEIFASPSVDAVLACILAVTGKAGCLLIVKNYTGDRLNFGLAAERAKNMGKKVEMVIVSDDIALPDSPQPRGIAGTVLVHKVAGHHAAQGDDLSTVRAAADRTARAVRSIGLSLAPCDLPGQPARSPQQAGELGLGIHGEPGVEKVNVDGATHAVSLLVDRLIEQDFGTDKPLVMLINNLGSVTPMEMEIITQSVLASPLGRRISLLLGPAPCMTSLNMYGFSLSALALTPALEKALRSPVAPRAWPQATAIGEPAIRAVSNDVTRWPFQAQPDKTNEVLVRAVCTALINAESMLNALDTKVGDADTGTTFAYAARAVIEALDKPALPLANRADFCLALGQILSSAMGGSSGVLISIFFTTTGNELNEGASIDQAMVAGANAIQQYGGAARGQRTLLDALLPALEALVNAETIDRAAQAARAGAEATRHVEKTSVGRSAYLSPDTLSGVADPGAIGVAIMFETAAKALA